MWHREQTILTSTWQWNGSADPISGNGRFVYLTQFEFEPVPEPVFGMSIAYVMLIVAGQLRSKRA